MVNGSSCLLIVNGSNYIDRQVNVTAQMLWHKCYGATDLIDIPIYITMIHCIIPLYHYINGTYNDMVLQQNNNFKI